MKSNLVLIFILWCAISGCVQQPTLPKPTGYFRIDIPEKSYRTYQVKNQSLSFQIPETSEVNYVHNPHQDSVWIDIRMPRYNASIHLTYKKKVPLPLNQLVEDVFTITQKQLKKASRVKESKIRYPQKKVYGTWIELTGNVGTSTQFFLTDSTQHFLYGALYFYAPSNYDSISPLIYFMRDNMDTMIQSLTW